MAKINLKQSKNMTKVGSAVERTVKWLVIVTEENIEEFKILTKNADLSLDESVELEGQVFIKRLDFKAARDAAKAFDWDVDYDNLENSKLKAVDSDRLEAARLIGSVCIDEKGTPFFENVQDVYTSDPNFTTALYKLSDDLNNFLGKSRTKTLSDTNSSANSSSTELAVEPSKKPSEQSA